MSNKNFYTVKLPKKQTHAFLKKAAKKKLDTLQNFRAGNYQLPVKAHTSSNAKAALAVTFIYSAVALVGVGVLVVRELKRNDKGELWVHDDKDLSKRASHLKNNASDAAENLTEKVKGAADDTADKAKDTAADVADKADNAVDDVKNKTR